MNERLKELAEQYACHIETMTGLEVEYIFDIEDLQDFVELVRQDEREACAKLCEKFIPSFGDGVFFAKVIRARGEK
jgi:hypothetical protein